MKITVMGLGYIGLPTAITLAEAGFEVCGFDVNKKTIETLQGGHIHIVEPGLQEAFEKAVAHGHLHFSDTLGKSDVFYISVPTPFYKDETGSHKADLKFVESAGRMAGKVLEAPNLVILESTVPPHTSEMLARVLSEESGIPMEKIHVAHCPERVIPGNMMYELKNNDRIVGARTPEAAEMAASIYEKVLDKGVVHKTDDLTAEMCKLTENTFRDVNIAYANELSVICDKMGIDVFELIKLANCHPRVNILTPGVGVGGHCIAVDPWFIYEQFPAEAKVILAARERRALERILQELHQFCEDGPAKDEISRTREQAKTTLLMGLENTGTRMMTIGRSELIRGEVSKIEDVLAGYDSVTRDDILELARRIFDPAQASLAVVGNPGSEDEYRELLSKHL